MKKPLILVIDDEKDILELLRYNFEAEGYEVAVCPDGESGLEAARSKLPAVIVLDLMLPALDGLEVCRILKSSSETKNIPILMLTAKSSEVDQVVGLALGASDYVSKPFSVKVLTARVKNLLRKPAAQTENGSLVQNGDFSLHKEKLIFTLKKKRVRLTKTEFNILGALLEHPETVFTRQRLISEVWGSGCLVSAAAVNMQIKSLREKLGKHKRHLQTVRGSGYRFEP